MALTEQDIQAMADIAKRTSNGPIKVMVIDTLALAGAEPPKC